MLRWRYILLVIVLPVLVGCKPHVVREAEVTLAEADSLRTHGIPPTDSARLAQTVADLSPWRYIYPTDYAKANYYYGYLLRAKGNYPAAMECFIDATHSRSKDYMWIGKAWTNIGDFCRSDGNYDLAYDVHVRAAEAFKRDNNTRAYYYELNNMAVVRAFQKDRNAVQEILSTIERECTDSAVLTKILETRAFLYGNVRVFDSVMYFVNAVLSKGFPVATCYVEKAQAFWWMNQYDSALYYAQIALSHHCSLREKVDMLYITSHNDPTIDSDSILAITSERADLQRILTNQKSQLSHAVEILQQSMKPNYKWVYAIIVTLIIIGILLSIVWLTTQKHRAAKQMQLKQMETRLQEGKQTLAQTQTQNEVLTNSNKEMYENRMAQFTNNCTAIRGSHDLKKELSWNDYEAMCNIVNLHLFLLANKLEQLGVLSEKEIRFCILVAIQLSQKEMADILPYSHNGIGKFKYSVSKKLETNAKNLYNFLTNLAISV